MLQRGHVIQAVENRDGLDAIRDLAAHAAARHLGVSPPNDPERFLNGIGEHVDATTLNDLRISVINALRSEDWFRPTYFSLAREALFKIVGNEIAMQRGVGLSVQLPNDDSSLLPVHADTWDGDSPYEVVVWVPLVDCFRTKAMYLLTPDKQTAHLKTMASNNSAETFFKSIEDDVEYISIDYGNVLIFRLDLPHGNRVNTETEARWSMNCRFKSVLTPFADKQLGEFFEPIIIRPATKVGMTYELPGGFGGAGQ
ncbi:MAG: hypothetical protein CMM77_08975 [Rhodospirillaceae bacterium]|nr:hypothetical protein [Magnetovibrio sp.]MAY67246.1 hypothetical protein [Rhodospirillaceae bacterium]